MFRIHALMTASLLSVALAAPALAQDRSGAKTREQVNAELAAANRSYSPSIDVRPRTATPGLPLPMASRSLAGSGDLTFEAPAAGARTREEVLLELQRAREDGSLRRMNSNRGY